MSKRRKVSPRERARRRTQAAGPAPASTPAAELPAVPVAPANATALSADEYRSASGFRFQLPSRPGKYVLIRRTDLFSLFMADAVPLNLLETVGELEAMQKAIEANPQALAMMDAAKKSAIVGAIDRVCCVVVAQPTIVLERDTDPAHLFCGDMAISDKMAIFLASQYPPALKDSDESVPPLPRLTGDAARTFRGTEPRTHGVAASDGQVLRPGAVVVDVPGVGPVEYVGA